MGLYIPKPHREMIICIFKCATSFWYPIHSLIFKAKIILKSGKKFKGLIVGDEKNSITLKVKTQGGSIEMQMNYEKIKKASIYK